MTWSRERIMRRFTRRKPCCWRKGTGRRPHRGLQTLFGLVLVKTGKFEKKWGKFLANLKDDREAGDYEALSYLDEQTATRALTEAEEFVGTVEAFLGQRDG